MYINDEQIANNIHKGFYDDLDNLNELNIDDVADCAEADIDLIGDPDIVEYAADLNLADPVEASPNNVDTVFTKINPI